MIDILTTQSHQAKSYNDPRLSAFKTAMQRNAMQRETQCRSRQRKEKKVAQNLRRPSGLSKENQSSVGETAVFHARVHGPCYIVPATSPIHL
jgi:hypothetical protein